MSRCVALRRVVEFNPPIPQSVRSVADASARLLPMDAIQHFDEPGEGELRPIRKLLQGYAYLEPTDVAYAKVTPCFENGKGLIGTDLESFSFASSEVTVLRPSLQLDQQYLSYVLRSESFRGPAISSMTGAGGLKRVDEQDMRSHKIWLPPINVQRSIADFLDRETAEIDAFIADQEELIALLEERRTATISHTVTKGLDPDAPMKDSGVEWVGSIPASWNTKRMSWLFGDISSGTTPPNSKPEYYGGEFNWVTTGELRERGICETYRTITHRALQELSALRLYPPGTLLIAMYGATVGRLGILEVSATTNQACCAFSRPIETNPNFIFYVLLAAREHLEFLADGGGQPNINQEKLRSLRVPHPDYKSQEEIVSFLGRETTEFDAAVADAREAIALSRERRAALISAAVTGQIDVTQKRRPVAKVLEDEVGVRV